MSNDESKNPKDPIPGIDMSELNSLIDATKAKKANSDENETSTVSKAKFVPYWSPNGSGWIVYVNDNPLHILPQNSKSEDSFKDHVRQMKEIVTLAEKVTTSGRVKEVQWENEPVFIEVDAPEFHIENNDGTRLLLDRGTPLLSYKMTEKGIDIHLDTKIKMKLSSFKLFIKIISSVLYPTKKNNIDDIELF